ncbi:MAG: hypothetical protein JOS17DRAFT_772647 [Linnemannia elongata]|nr:MAG: hypothetical protein JOS17DRAFT_772647 [Linnemannia elongata]
MATSTNDNDTMEFDDNGNIVPAVQINITQQRDNRPPAIQVLATAELVNHIVRYLPATSYPACSLINRIWREAILFSSLTYKASLLSTQQWIESTPRRIFILSAYILQYSAAVDAGLPPGGVSSNQFVFSCQTRSVSVDSYGSSGSNSDQKSGASSGHTRTSGESSGSVSHLQRHHTHQPGHDVEPFHSFHTYQSSAIVPNVYFKTSIQLPPHLSSPPPLPPLPIAQQINYTFPSSPPPSSQQQSPSQGGPSIPPSSSQPHQQQPHQYHQTTTGFLPGQHVSTMDTRPTIDQLLGYPLPLPSSSHPRVSSTDTELSSSDLHHYEADISTDSNQSSMMVVDVADLSLSPGQILLPPHGLSTFPTPETSSSSTPRQQQYQQQQQHSIPSSSSTTPIPMRQHEQQYQQQQPMVRVVPCPYELPTEGSMQYEENVATAKKGSRTSTESTHSHDSTISTSSSCSSSGESHHGIVDPSSSSVSVLQGGAYTPYASPIMEESSNPSVFGSPYAVVGAGGVGVGSSSGARVSSTGRGSGGQGQGSSSPASARMSGKELAPDYQQALALREHNQQLQQLQRQSGRMHEISSRDDIPMTHIGGRGDVRMDSTRSGEMSDQTDPGRRSSVNTNSPPSYRTSSASSTVHHQQQQHHHHHHHSHHHHDQGGICSAIDSSTTPIPTSTSFSSSGTNSHQHSHHHSHRHQQRQQRARQQQQQQQQKQHQNQPPNARPSRNWSMAVQTFYYQNSALNAMIVACREHMISPEGQGGAIVEKTDTSRIIWNDTTRQEHIWTITPTLMDRTNPDFVEADFDPEFDYA